MSAVRGGRLLMKLLSLVTVNGAKIEQVVITGFQQHNAFTSIN